MLVFASFVCDFVNCLAGRFRGRSFSGGAARSQRNLLPLARPLRCFHPLSAEPASSGAGHSGGAARSQRNLLPLALPLQSYHPLSVELASAERTHCGAAAHCQRNSLPLSASPCGCCRSLSAELPSAHSALLPRFRHLSAELPSSRAHYGGSATSQRNSLPLARSIRRFRLATSCTSRLRGSKKKHPAD